MTNTISTPARIVIVDDHPMLREGLAMRISAKPDLAVCGEAATEEEGLALVKRRSPDLVIVDISLKSGHGIDLIKRIKARHPKVKMLVVSGYDESLYAERSLRAGALGYLNKQETNEKVIDAIRTVLDGRRYLSPKMTQQLVGQAIGSGQPGGDDPIHRLSNRELEVFQLIGRGQPTGSIAAQLQISIHTVESHRHTIRRKLHLKNGAELTQRAVQWVLENG
jgi:DNA-binding NarL/FixJ family response regulator